MGKSFRYWTKRLIVTFCQYLFFRERKDELPKMQVGFIDVICLPLYRVLSETFPWIRPLYEGTVENRQNWQDLAEKVEMGLTWIDHDTIDKPVEEFSGKYTLLLFFPGLDHFMF